MKHYYSQNAAQPTSADLQSRIVEFSKMIGEKMDKLADEISSINRRFSELERSVQFNSENLVQIELKEIPNLQTSIESGVK